jgi:hypothetical protein
MNRGEGQALKLRKDPTKSGVVGSKSSSRRFLFAHLDAPSGQSAKLTVEAQRYETGGGVGS